MGQGQELRDERAAAPKSEGTPAAAPASRTKRAIGDAQGFEAQEAKLDPDKQPDLSGSAPKAEPGPLAPPSPGAADKTATDAKADAAEGAAPAPTDAKAQAAAQGVPPEVVDGQQVEKLTPIREALMKQFELMEGKGIGMKEFDAVCSEASWNKFKAEEKAQTAAAEVKYQLALGLYHAGCATDPTYAKTHPQPARDYVPIYTTCIDTQNAVARAAWRASGLAAKRLDGQDFDQVAFGGASRTEGQKLGAWVEAAPGSGQTPKPGDMLMLEKAGATLDKAAGEGRVNDWTNGAKVRTLQKQLDGLKQASESADKAIADASAAKAKAVEEALAKAKGDFDAAQAVVQKHYDEAAASLAKQVAGGAKLQFSHVGFFKSAADEQQDGQKTGRQIWQTFDGGQSGIAGAVSGQGAKSMTRYYDPKTNLISGEASQGGDARWLAGWIDVDKMVKTDDGKKDGDDAKKAAT